MTRKEVINGLEHCKTGDCVGCPYDQIKEESLHGKHNKWKLVCNEQLTEDVLSLLKEQEAVNPIEKNGFYYCSSCRYPLMTSRQKYCSNCGSMQICIRG